MVDVFTSEKRSWVMSRIRGKNTGPEKAVRSFLHRHGFRFRLHVRRLPGNPDIVLPKFKTVILVHGCFWHHHHNCRNAVFPKTRKHFWRKKIEGTRKRDVHAKRLLGQLGWSVITLWECKIERKPEECLKRLLTKLFSLSEGHSCGML